jgi:SH3-like domain-containing protein
MVNNELTASFLGDRKMLTRINLFIIVCLVGLSTVGLAQESGTSGETAVPSFPYVAQIIADDVYIRSGPGTNYYHCSKLNKGEKVVVVGSKFSWSRIVPPEGSFSWISKQYVSIDPANPGIGVVTGDAVRVYAGSEAQKPIHSEKVQIQLNKSEKVKIILGEEEASDYYKIVPPSGAYLWVSTRYIEPVGPVSESALPVEAQAKAGAEAVTEAEPATEPEAKPVVEAAVEPKPEPAATRAAPVEASVEDAKLKEYYALEKQIKAELAKPATQQKYTSIKSELSAIAANKAAGKAARYAEFALEQVKCFELASQITDALKLQSAQLEEVQKRIDKAREAKLAQMPDMGKFAVIGKLAISNIYATRAAVRHYRVLDESGRTVCYAVPSGAALGVDLGKFVGQKVGLVGSIEPNPQTSSALVKFTEISQLK